MRILHYCMASIFTLVLFADARASVISGPTKDPANGNTYYLLSTDTWTNSEAAAVAMGGHLATVTNAAENTWIFNTFGGVSSNATQNLWIGLYDPTLGDGTGALHASDFKWSSGSPVTYTNWGSGEPNNIQSVGGEYYAQLDIINFPPNLPPPELE